MQRCHKLAWITNLLLTGMQGEHCHRLSQELAAAALAEQDKESSRGSTPQTDYHEKYEKLLGRESGKDAAKITTPNKQFGFGMLSAQSLHFCHILHSIARSISPAGLPSSLESYLGTTSRCPQKHDLQVPDYHGKIFTVHIRAIFGMIKSPVENWLFKAGSVSFPQSRATTTRNLEYL